MFSLIEIESLLKLPCHVYMKDMRGIYRECNMAQARSFGATHTDDIIGKSDFQLHPNSDECRMCAVNDLEVLKTETPKFIVEPIKFVNRPLVNMLSYKLPYYDKSNKLIGVLGVSVVLTEAQSLYLPSFDERENVSSENNIKVTRREKECLDHLAQGLTAKQIARKLGLSSRTIEFYIENMKRKLNCTNRIQLIAKTRHLIK